MPGERVKKDVEQRVDAGWERSHEQQHSFRCFWSSGRETQQGGEGEEGNGEVEEAIGEEQPGNVSSHCHIFLRGGWSFVDLAVETSVGEGHEEETQ